MKYRNLLKANLRRHKKSMIGIFILTFLICTSFLAVLSVWSNAKSYVKEEMNRLGFGEITAWISGLSDVESLKKEMEMLPEIEHIKLQPLIYSSYRIGEQESDSEGQLIIYNPEEYAYKIFSNDLSKYEAKPTIINSGEIYISPSLHSMFDINLGDEIIFPVTRHKDDEERFIVKGYFEDPFMGSSMIGMKSFLICQEDSIRIAQKIGTSGIDGLARTGFMLHIMQKEDSLISALKLNERINENTELPNYTEFVHSSNSISGFMLILYEVFAGLFAAFVIVLFIVTLIVLSHSLSNILEQDNTNIGILKTLGFTSAKLRYLQIMQYLPSILCGFIFGMPTAYVLVYTLNHMTITSTGLKIPSKFPIALVSLALSSIFLVFLAFIFIKTTKIGRITPVKAICKTEEYTQKSIKSAYSIHKKGLTFYLVLRQLAAGKKRYIGTCIIAALLVFFASMIGRVNSWLGEDGKGMMDAFNPADLNIGVQPIGDISIEEIEQTISSYTAIADSYLLAMPSVSINGIDYTANVISEPERFHILKGKTCEKENEIVLTEFAAKDLNAEIGDTVLVRFGSNSREYQVSGIYQCANDMGNNIGMSRLAYLQIGEEASSMWCRHYFLTDINQKQAVIKALNDTYKTGVYVHENSWPGLYGIIGAMQTLLVFMYILTAAFILIVTMLTGSKLLIMEQKDMGIYKVIGFTSHKLRIIFAVRFGVVSFIGAVIGIFLSTAFTDFLIGKLLKICGISSFSSYLSVGTMLFPMVIVVTVFCIFAYVAAGKIKKSNLMVLITE